MHPARIHVAGEVPSQPSLEMVVGPADTLAGARGDPDPETQLSCTWIPGL